MQTTNDELTIKLYETIKIEDIKKASDEGCLLIYFSGIVKRIFPTTKNDRKGKIEDSVRIGEY